jgi:hypothetical protein
MRSLEDWPKNLFCLAILAKLSAETLWNLAPNGSLSSQASDGPKNPVSPSLSNLYCAARKFFTGKRGSKTLDLVVLQVILLCSGGKCDPQSHESLLLAKEVVEVFDINERTSWVDKSSDRILKLYEKIIRPEIDARIRVPAFEIIASLVGADRVPTDVIVALQGILQRPRLRCDIRKVACLYGPRLQDSFVSSQLLNALQVAVTEQSPTNTSITDLENAHCIVSGLIEATKISSGTRSVLLISLSSNAFQENLSLLVDGKSSLRLGTFSHEAQTICSCKMALLKRNLQRDICVLLLTAALRASSDQMGIDPSLATSLLVKVASLSFDPPLCKTFELDAKLHTSSLSLFRVATTPLNTSGSRDWRVQVQDDLRRDASRCHEIVIHRMGEICRNLEVRCTEVEQPLRLERERVCELQIRLHDANSKLKELQDDAQERVVIMDGLEVEKNQLSRQLHTIELRLERKSNDLEKAKRQLDQAISDAADSANSAQKIGKQKELELLASLTATEDLNEQQQSKLLSMETKVKSIAQELQVSRERATSLEAGIGALREELRQREILAESSRQSIMQDKARIEKLVSIENELSNKLQKVNLDFNSLQSAGEEARLDHREQISSLESSHSLVCQDFTSQLNQKDKQIAQDKAHHEEAIQALQRKSNTAQAAVTKEIESYKRKIRDLKQKLGQLDKQRKERAKEFAEAQNLSSKLMIIMGNKGQMILHDSHDSQAVNNISQPTSTSDNGEEGCMQGALDGVTPSSSTTSSKSGPTPKRLRVRKQYASHEIKALPNKMRKPLSENLQSSQRVPLEDLGRHTKSQANISPKKGPGKANDNFSHDCYDKDENYIEGTLRRTDDDEFDFSDSQIFTSTDFRLVNPSRPHAVNDETAADF